MNLGHIFLIFKIELLKIFRQKNIFLTLFVYPFLYIPIIGSIGFTMYFFANQSGKAEKVEILWIGEKIEKLNENLEKQEFFKISYDENAALKKSLAEFVSYGKKLDEMYKKAVAEKKGSKQLVQKDHSKSYYDKIIQTLKESNKQILLYSYIDQDGSYQLLSFKGQLSDNFVKSEVINSTLNKAVEKEFERLRELNLKNAGLKLSHINPISLKYASSSHIGGVNIESSSQIEFNFVGIMLPYLICLIMISIIYYPIVSSVAEEKELNTIENMLVSPVGVLDLILGKLLCIEVFLLIGLVPYLLQYGVVTLFSDKLSFLQKAGQVLLPSGVSELLGPFLVVVSFGFLCCSLVFLLCSFSSSKQQAQQMYGYCVMVLLGGVFMTPIMGTSLSLGKMYVPLINFSVYFSNILSGEITWWHTFICLMSNLVFSYILILFAREFYDKQYYRLDSRYGINDLLHFKSMKLVRPVAPLGFIVFVVLVMTIIYSKSLVKDYSLNVGIMLNLLVGAALIPLYLLRKYGIEWRQVWPWTKPRTSLIALSLLVGVLLPFFNMSVISLFPGIQELSKNLPKLGTHLYPFWYQVYLICLLPALCEEFVFRGVILKSFMERFGHKFSIFLSALFFAFAHVDAIRFLPTFLIGLIAGFFVFKHRSMLYAIIIHFTNNLVGVILLNVVSINKEETATAAAPQQYGVLLITFIFLSLFLWLSFRKTKEEVVYA
jgi:sodium transport system permease protein